MPSSSTITISNGASLTLENCHIYACTDMWQGIVVSPGGSLEITDGSLIEDAIKAVDLTSPNTSTYLTVNNAIFNKNFDAITIDGFQTTSGYGNFSISNTVFTCRDLQPSSTWPTLATLEVLSGTGTLSEHYDMGGYTTTTLKYPHTGDKSNSGITLTDVGSGSYNELIIDGDNSNSTFNLFDNMLFGINADNTNLSCYNNVFQYIIEENSWTDGIAINATDLSAGYATDNRLRVTDDGESGINTFYDCTTGINVDGYKDITITYTDMRSTQMTPSVPLEGKAGMYINTANCNQVTVDHNTFTNLRKAVQFTADGAAATVGGTYYTNAQNIGDVDITNNVIQANYSGVTLTNEYPKVGIIANNLITYTSYVLTYPTSNPINVSDNQLYNVYIGISMNNWRYTYSFTGGTAYDFGNRAVARDNYIQLKEQTYPSSGQPQVGVYHTNNYSNYIINNNVQGFGISSNTWAGIYSDNLSPGTDGNTTKVECNLTENIAIGNYFSNNHGYISYKKNEMKTSALGLLLDNAIIGNQGNSSYASDNKWTGSYPSGTYTTFTQNNSDPNYSNLFVQNTGSYNPATVGNGCGSINGSSYTYSYGNGIDYAANASTLSCDARPTGKLMETHTSSELFSENNAIANLELLVTENGMEYGIYPDEQYINAQHRVYRMLKLLPDYKDSSTVLSDFYTQKQNSNVAELATVEHTLALGRLNDAEALLSSISPDNDIEANYKNYYTAYVHYKKQVCTATDSSTLLNMAMGCAARDGDIIHRARSLYNLLYNDDDYRIYFDDCSDAIHSIGRNRLTAVSTTQNNQEGFVVYPNPSSGEVWLQFEHILDKKIEIKIYSMEGTLIHSEKTTNPKINYNFSNGIYILHVETNDGYQYSPQRITIIN